MYIFKYINTSQQCYLIIPCNLCLLMYRESRKKDTDKSGKRKRSEFFRFLTNSLNAKVLPINSFRFQQTKQSHNLKPNKLITINRDQKMMIFFFITITYRPRKVIEFEEQNRENIRKKYLEKYDSSCYP